MSTVLWQRIEGGLVFVAVLVLVMALVLMAGVPWWLCVILFFAPDLGFLGYLGGPKAGALVYNALHLYGGGLALIALAVGVYGNTMLAAAGLLWLGHVGFDRMLGYGLKEPTDFGDTHLCRIGRG